MAIMVRVSMRPARPGKGADVDPRAHQQHGVVGGEEAAVVGEDDETEALDLGVGRVDVGDVDAAARQRLVGDAVVDACRRRAAPPVGGGESRPAIGPLQELVGEGEPQPDALGHQVGDRADAERLGADLRHGQGVRVAEAEWNRRLEPPWREPGVERLQRRAAVTLQELAHDRAGVFRIEVDGAAGQRPLEDARVAEALPVLRRSSGRHQRPRDDLAQDVRLGEALRADDHRFLLGGSGPGAR
jgi:hypothetical protein